jgi:hypothetical protein
MLHNHRLGFGMPAVPISTPREKTSPTLTLTFASSYKREAAPTKHQIGVNISNIGKMH